MKAVLMFLAGALIGAGTLFFIQYEPEIEYDPEAGSCEGATVDEE